MSGAVSSLEPVAPEARAMPLGEATSADLVTVEWFFRIAEGGHKTRYPYGIKSIRTADPRRVCIRTITNRLKLWDGKSPFIPFLADRYCPKSTDPVGHGRWIKNVTFHYEKATLR